MSEVVPVSSKSGAPAPSRWGIPVWVQRTLIGTVTVAAVGLAGLAVLPLFVDGESFRKPLQEALSAATRRTVLLGRIDLRTLGGIGLGTDQLRVVRANGTVELQARSAFVEVGLLSLLQRRLEVQMIELDGAEVNINRDRSGVWNFADFTEARSSGAAVDLAQTGIKLIESTINIADDFPQVPQRFQVSSLSLNLQKLDLKDLPLSLQGTVTNGAGKPLGSLTVDGNFALAESGDWQKLSGNARILAKKFRPRLVKAYTQGIESIQGLTGVYDLDLVWKGEGGESRLEGTVLARLLRWDWPRFFPGEPWLVRGVTIDGAVNIGERAIVAERFDIKGANLDAKLKGTVTRPVQPEEKPELDLTVKTGFIDPYALRPSVPVDLIPEQWRSWVTRSKGSGKLSADFTVRGPLDKVVALGTFDFQNFKIANPRLTAPVENLNGRLALGENDYTLTDLRIGRSGEQATINGTVGREANAAVDLKITSGSADLTAFSNLGAGRLGILGGRGILDLAITGTLQAPQVIGRTDLEGASLMRAGWVQPLKNMRGRVVFEPDKVTLAGLNAELGVSQVSIDGLVTGYGTPALNPQLVISSDSLDLKAAYAVLSSDLLDGNFRRSFRSTFRGMAGRAGVDLKIQGSATTGRLNLRGASLGIGVLPVDIEGAYGAVTLSERGTAFEQLRATMAGSAMNLKGSIGRGGDIQLSGDGTLNFPSAVALLPAPSRAGVRAIGSVPVSFSVNGSASERQWQGQFDLSNLRELTLANTFKLAPAERLVASGVSTSQSLTVNNARLDLSDLNLSIDGSVSQPGRINQRYNLRVRSEQSVPVQTLGRYAVALDNLGITGGSTNLDLVIVGSATVPGLVGSLDLNGTSVPGLLGGLEEINGSVSFDGNRASTQGLSFRYDGQATGRLSGSLTNLQNPQLDFEARLDRLNFDTLREATGVIKSLQGRGTLRIESGVISRLPFTNLSAQARLDRGLWSLSDLSVSTAGGRLAGSMTADLRAAIPAFNGNITFSNADSNQLASQLLNFSNQISGESDLNLIFQAQGSTTEAFLASLSGRGSLAVRNGRVSGLDLLGPLFGAVEGQLRGNGSAGGFVGAVRGLNTGKFEKLSGSFRLEGGNAITDDFVYTASGFQMKPNGTLTLIDRNANLRVLGDFDRSGNGGAIGNFLKLPGGTALRSFAFEVAGPLNQGSSVRDVRLVDPQTEAPRASEPGNLGSTP